MPLMLKASVCSAVALHGCGSLMSMSVSRYVILSLMNYSTCPPLLSVSLSLSLSKTACTL